MIDVPPLIRSLVDASVDAASVVDPELNVLYFNSNYLRLGRLRARALRNRSVRGMCHEHFGLESCTEGCVALRAFRSGRPCRVDEVTSSRLPLALIVVASPLFDANGEVYAVMELYRDVTAESRLQENYRTLLQQERAHKERLAAEVARQTIELERANESLRAALGEVSRMAQHDSLTELANRRHFDEQFAAKLTHAREHATVLSLVVFDLDHFKRINDVMGHPAGDKVLQQFAQAMRGAVRDRDLVARIGGEEFALVLYGASVAQAQMIAGRVREGARQIRLATTASGGIACFPEDGRTAAELLSAADRALYAAKHAGRDRVLTADAVRDAPVAVSIATPVDGERGTTAALPIRDAALPRTLDPAEVIAFGRRAHESS